MAHKNSRTSFPHGANVDEMSPEFLFSEYIKAQKTFTEAETRLADLRGKVLGIEAISELIGAQGKANGAAKKKAGRPKGTKGPPTTKGTATQTRGGFATPEEIAKAIKAAGQPVAKKDLVAAGLKLSQTWSKDLLASEYKKQIKATGEKAAARYAWKG